MNATHEKLEGGMCLRCEVLPDISVREDGFTLVQCCGCRRFTIGKTTGEAVVKWERINVKEPYSYKPEPEQSETVYYPHYCYKCQFNYFGTIHGVVRSCPCCQSDDVKAVFEEMP